jgi:predicted branched-subunit amino acid permease
MRALFSADGFWRGARDGLPLGASILVYGLAFGLVASQAMLSLTQALTMSAAVYSGSAQLAAVNLMQSGQATLLSLAATIMVINARYVLFGAALRPWLGQAHPVQAYGSLLLLGDANWIFTMRAIAAGEVDRAYLAGSGLPMFAGWMTGTLLGVTFGSVLPDAHQLGFDLMLPAFAAAMMAAMMKTRASIVPVLTGAIVAVATATFAGPGWAIIAAGIAGAILAAALWQPGRG